MKRIGVKHALLIISMAGCLTFLYIQVQKHNIHHHQQRVLILQKLKHWETTLNQDILRVQMGLLAHYDTLRVSMIQLRDGLNILKQGPLALTHLDVPAFQTQLQFYDQQLQEKEQQLQQFKTQHSTLRNSLLFFPLAMENVRRVMDIHDTSRFLKQKADEILKQMLLYIDRPDLSRKVSLTSLTQDFNNQKSGVVDKVRQEMDSVLAHASIILEHQERVSVLARSVIISGSEQGLLHLTHDYVMYQETLARIREKYLMGMYLLGIMLIGYVAFLFVRLQYSAQRLDKANSDLEQRVTERTKKLALVVKDLEHEVCERVRTEEELALARDNALAAMEAKSEFLATMSHEIRTPMNGVIGMTSLLLETPLSSDQQHYAEIVRSSGEVLLTVINDILDFSKIESGKLEVETINFDLRVAVEETLELFAERAVAQKIELVGWVFEDVPTALQGDPGRLRQILMNLIGNAIKFTDNGDVSIQVLRVEENQDEVEVRFEITDTGIGIAPESLKRLFQPFSQADSSTTRKYGGTGLGLAISKQLVELMDGTIGVNTIPEQGSQFWFTVKLKKQVSAESLDNRSNVFLQGLRVCCLDDHPVNRFLMMQYCIDWGMDGVEAATPTEALELLKSAVKDGKPFDLALVDMELPGMEGSALAKMIKADSTIAHTKLVLVTSLGRQGDATLARQAGFSGHFTKPVRKAQMLECLKLVMAQTESETLTAPMMTQHTIREEMAQRRARVLVADDHTINQQLAVLMLEQMGHRVDVVANGLEAVEAFSRKSYDVVFMDCQMPEMDGYEATKEIRHRERTGNMHGGCRVSIIAMTANAMQGDREKCLAAGMDDYLSKPIKREGLKKILDRWTPADTKVPELISEN